MTPPRNLAAVASAAIGVLLAFVAYSILSSGERSLLMIIGGVAAAGAVVMLLGALRLYGQGPRRRSRRR
jgi:hypothetical protein